MMKKIFLKRFLSVALITVICLTMLPARAQAGTTYKYVYKAAGTLNAGEYIKAKPAETTYNSSKDRETKTYFCYKIKIPENGFIKITTTSRFSGNVFILPALSKCSSAKEPADNSADFTWFYDSSWKNSVRVRYIALNKGTYYLCSTSSAGKVKYTFKQAGSYANYCQKKAISLAKNKSRFICFTKGYEHSRWFKIKLTKKQKINVTLKSYDENDLQYFDLYDSKGNYVPCPQLSGNVYQSAKKPAGIYYIKVNYPTDSWLASGFVYSLSWK